jgi:hypothetical protein
MTQGKRRIPAMITRAFTTVQKNQNKINRGKSSEHRGKNHPQKPHTGLTPRLNAGPDFATKPENKRTEQKLRKKTEAASQEPAVPSFLEPNKTQIEKTTRERNTSTDKQRERIPGKHTRTDCRRHHPKEPSPGKSVNQHADHLYLYVKELARQEEPE